MEELINKPVNSDGASHLPPTEAVPSGVIDPLRLKAENDMLEIELARRQRLLDHARMGGRAEAGIPTATPEQTREKESNEYLDKVFAMVGKKRV